MKDQLDVTCNLCFSLQNEHHPKPAAPNLQYTTNWEQYDRCGNQQHSRRLLKMDILMSETCWAHKKWNKVASDIKLVVHSSTICTCNAVFSARYKLKLYKGCNVYPLQFRQFLSLGDADVARRTLRPITSSEAELTVKGRQSCKAHWPLWRVRLTQNTGSELLTHTQKQ